MHKEKRALKKNTAIRIEPYLAEYVAGKYGVEQKNGAVKIPYTSDLYHCIWENMSRKRSNQTEPEDGNLLIQLPFRKAGNGIPWKDPAYYNYLSPSASKIIEAQIRRMFNFELHRVLLENEEFGRQRKNLDVIYDFIRTYHLKSISPDALLKNFYRFRNRLRPKKVRQYKKTVLN
ncbi:hypothetical protein [Hoylesella marshii]|uniref:Uncharacterized protein n=1 Tax=Hoylesella marshii DSM 16973 = JCM 13450 TaxID=862515 RepID=E0NSV6_9BACT|nr:hypothetical protein [Hoylesella marshii]EFM01820.1 hypothetical protein HMPREF0658_1308 [Hoylesella marshii DSM 16973 = JCM 13450]